MPATASVRLNSVATPNETYALGGTVALSNNDNTGVSTWAWTLLAKPTGSTATITGPTNATASLVADVEGSYLVRLVVNAGLPDESQSTAVARVLHQHTSTASMAKDETGEGDPTEGWARRSRQNNVALDRRLGLADRRTVRYVGSNTTGPKILTATGTTTLANGDVVPTVDILSAGAVASDACLWDGGALSANTTITPVRRGLSLAFANPDSMVVNDPVYLGTSGALTKTPPSVDRAYLVGYCAAVSGGNIVVWFDPVVRFNNLTAPAGLVVDGSGVAGTSQQSAHADHQHPLVTFSGTPTAVSGATGSAGTSGAAPARGDHQHALTTYSTTPANITDSAGSAGTAGTAPARGDHAHAHGNRGGGSLHAVATTSVDGFLSASDKTKLDTLRVSRTVTTTGDATPTIAQTLTPANGQAEIVDMLIIAMRKSGGGAVGDAAYYRRTFGMKRISGVTYLMGPSPFMVDGGTYEDVAGWNVQVDVSSPDVRVLVTGAASTIVVWTVQTTRVLVDPATAL